MDEVFPLFFGFRRGLVAQTALGVLEQAAGGKSAEFLEELRAEKLGRIGEARSSGGRLGEVLETLCNDEAGFLGRAGFEQGHGARLLDAIDIGLGEHAANLAVEVLEAGDDDDGVRQAIGDLDEIAGRLLEALLGVVEEAQVLDLIDREHERGALHGPHQHAERRDDLEGAVLAGVGIERADGLMRKRRQLAAEQVLAHALIETRVLALEIKKRADDIDVELELAEFGAGDDLVGEAQHEARQLVLGQRSVAQLGEILFRQDLGVAHQMRRQALQTAHALVVGVVGFLKGMDDAAQKIVGIVGHVRRHLGIAEIGLALAMGGRAQRPQKMRLSGPGLAVEQQDARMRSGATAGGDRRQELVEFPARLDVHLGDIDGIGPPNIVLPGDAVAQTPETACLVMRPQRLPDA